jgi:hypothetical protein
MKENFSVLASYLLYLEKKMTICRLIHGLLLYDMFWCVLFVRENE